LNWFSNKIAKQNTVGLWYHGIPEKVISTFATVFHTYYLVARNAKIYKKLKSLNYILSNHIDRTAKPAHPAAFFAMFWSALKKLSWNFNLLYTSKIFASNRFEKGSQLLEKMVFHVKMNLL
jgi:hypothetical protein